MLTLKHLMIIVVLSLSACTAVDKSNVVAGSGNQQEVDASERQYTFAWNFSERSNLKPRGGTSKGVPVTLDTKPSPEWLKLQEVGISELERDRRAILAMVGEYKVSFDFIEVAGFADGYQPQAPYQSWATEKVYVLENKPNFISLQHILVMQTMNKDGTKNKPMLTKHWRQDWQYQPKQVLKYKGYKTWEVEAVSPSQQKNSWSQTVYQVDDSPRYGGVSSWQHLGNYSSWNSLDTWRPLPRREYSVRSDYQLLLGENSHIILPTGWVHEQRNNKVVLDNNKQQAKVDAVNPVIAREFGYNRYERIMGYDFSLSDTYFKSTEPFWREVRKQWAQQSQLNKPIHLHATPGLFLPLFNYADEINAGKKIQQRDIASYAKEAVNDYLVNDHISKNDAGY